MTDYKLNATAASLLGFLHERPMSGWDLVSIAERRIGNFWSLTPSQVYRELSTMAKAGLIEAGPRGHRERQPYTLTATGREAFSDWVRRKPGKEIIRSPLLLTVLFGQHIPPAQLAGFLAEHRIRHAEQLAGYLAEHRIRPTERLVVDEQELAQAPQETLERRRFSLATLEFGIAYERAVLEWFDHVPEIIHGNNEDQDHDAIDDELAEAARIPTKAGAE